MKYYLTVFFSVIAISSYCQVDYAVSAISDELTENAYIVTRSENELIEIHSLQSMSITTSVAMTILNRKGSFAGSISMYYREGADKIKNYQVKIYDKHGKLVKKVKKKDFTDHSVYDGISMADDRRAISYQSDYSQFPYTIEYEYTKETPYTIFMPSWSPYKSYYNSVENSSISIRTYEGFEYQYLTKNVTPFASHFQLEKAPQKFTARDLPALVPESMGPHFSDIFPQVLFSPYRSRMDKTEANFQDWNSFGLWMYEAYLSDKSSLSEDTKIEVAKIINGLDTDFEKARALYEYAVNSTRYVSIQLGEGGWEPFYAEEVHEKKYGDCKALAMYTIALMKEAQLDPFYVVIEAGSSYKTSLEEEFPSVQGNHAIIGVPIQGDTIYADCTTSKLPFGYHSSFTDGRKALAISKSGGKLVTTHQYTDAQNSEVLNIRMSILPEENLTKVKIDNKLRGQRIYSRLSLSGMTEQELTDKYYPSFYPEFGKEKFKELDYGLRENHTYHENFDIHSTSIISKAGEYFLIPIHLFETPLAKVDAEDRSTALYIKDGFSKNYHYQIEVPADFQVPKLPKATTIESDFGKFDFKPIARNDRTVTFEIRMLLKSGTYAKDKASLYNNWLEQINTFSNNNILYKPNKT